MYPMSWLLGLKRTEKTQLQTFGEGAEDITQNESWDYVPGTKLVALAIREPSGPADLKVTTTSGRNNRGLTTRITRADARGTSRVTDIGYDPVVGHLAETFTQGGLTITARRHPTLGVVTRASDPNGAGGSYVYDTFGRTKQVSPDLAGAKALYYVPVLDGSGVFAVRDVTEGEPTRIAVFDRLARARLSLVQSLEPTSFAAVYTDYDGVGRVSRISTPRGYAPSAPLEGWQFTNYEYD